MNEGINDRILKIFDALISGKKELQEESFNIYNELVKEPENFIRGCFDIFSRFKEKDESKLSNEKRSIKIQALTCFFGLIHNFIGKLSKDFLIQLKDDLDSIVCKYPISDYIYIANIYIELCTDKESWAKSARSCKETLNDSELFSLHTALMSVMNKDFLLRYYPDTNSESDDFLWKSIKFGLSNDDWMKTIKTCRLYGSLASYFKDTHYFVDSFDDTIVKLCKESVTLDYMRFNEFWTVISNLFSVEPTTLPLFKRASEIAIQISENAEIPPDSRATVLSVFYNAMSELTADEFKKIFSIMIDLAYQYVVKTGESPEHFFDYLNLDSQIDKCYIFELIRNGIRELFSRENEAKWVVATVLFRIQIECSPTSFFLLFKKFLYFIDLVLVEPTPILGKIILCKCFRLFHKVLCYSSLDTKDMCSKFIPFMLSDNLELRIDGASAVHCIVEMSLPPQTGVFDILIECIDKVRADVAEVYYSSLAISIEKEQQIESKSLTQLVERTLKIFDNKDIESVYYSMIIANSLLCNYPQHSEQLVKLITDGVTILMNVDDINVQVLAVGQLCSFVLHRNEYLEFAAKFQDILLKLIQLDKPWELHTRQQALVFAAPIVSLLEKYFIKDANILQFVFQKGIELSSESDYDDAATLCKIIIGLAPYLTQDQLDLVSNILSEKVRTVERTESLTHLFASFEKVIRYSNPESTAFQNAISVIVDFFRGDIQAFSGVPPYTVDIDVYYIQYLIEFVRQVFVGDCPLVSIFTPDDPTIFTQNTSLFYNFILFIWTTMIDRGLCPLEYVPKIKAALIAEQSDEFSSQLVAYHIILSLFIKLKIINSEEVPISSILSMISYCVTEDMTLKGLHFSVSTLTWSYAREFGFLNELKPHILESYTFIETQHPFLSDLFIKNALDDLSGLSEDQDYIRCRCKAFIYLLSLGDRAQKTRGLTADIIDEISKQIDHLYNNNSYAKECIREFVSNLEEIKECLKKYLTES